MSWDDERTGGRADVLVGLAFAAAFVLMGACSVAGDAAGGTIPPLPTPVSGVVVPSPTPTLAPELERVYLPEVHGE